MNGIDVFGSTILMRLSVASISDWCRASSGREARPVATSSSTDCPDGSMLTGTSCVSTGTRRTPASRRNRRANSTLRPTMRRRTKPCRPPYPTFHHVSRNPAWREAADRCSKVTSEPPLLAFIFLGFRDEMRSSRHLLL